MTNSARHSHVSGAGPGTITPDGCAVSLWARLPAGDIPGMIDDAIAPGSTVLDLGAGAGRLAHPLAAAGHRVTAVDESAEMLARIHDAETVQSPIEDLELDRRFDAVLLASHLVNVPDVAARDRLLASCRRHVSPTGSVLIQRFTPQWAEQAAGYADLGNGIESDTAVERPEPNRPDLLSVVAVFTHGEERWEQAYTTCVLDDDALAATLARADLALDRWLSDDGRWVVALPVSG